VLNTFYFSFFFPKLLLMGGPVPTFGFGLGTGTIPYCVFATASPQASPWSRATSARNE
jgi:hypothetical protein